jgi:hydroxymethylpyrimidine/phosphomethylpyrimidine kinase
MSHIHHNPEGTVAATLTIAGSDSGGGAGIQADLKTFATLGVHGVCAIAALTAQTTRGVSAVHLPPASFLREQILCVLEDFDVRAVKIGMLADAERIECVAEALASYPDLPVVLDPVMVASSGARLLAEDAIAALRTHLLPRATVLTPNLPEAEVLLGRPLQDAAAVSDAAQELRSLGCAWVLMKGGHLLEGGQVNDRLYGPGQMQTWSQKRLDLQPHGTGCTLSAALAALLARGLPIADATREAILFVNRALTSAYRPGLGPLHVLDHAGAGRAFDAS